MKRQKPKENKGITLIALVITIIDYILYFILFFSIYFNLIILN